MEPRPDSLAEVARRVLRGGSFRMELADFLDGFRESPGDGALSEPPPLLAGTVGNGTWKDAYLAATAEFLAIRHQLERWAWFYEAERSLDEPAFACRSRAGRLFLLKDSPAAFKSRNLFVSANALDRV